MYSLGVTWEIILFLFLWSGNSLTTKNCSKKHVYRSLHMRKACGYRVVRSSRLYNIADKWLWLHIDSNMFMPPSASQRNHYSASADLHLELGKIIPIKKQDWRCCFVLNCRQKLCELHLQFQLILTDAEQYWAMRSHAEPCGAMLSHAEQYWTTITNS